MRSALLILVILSGCAGPPKLVEYERPQSASVEEFEKQIESAPIVIVGKILSDVLADRWTRTNPEPPELRRLGVQVENVLRGEIKAEPVSIYYFVTTGGYDGPPPLGFWSLGERRIFYVRPDSGVLRMACDIVDHCTLPVLSGAHPLYKPDPTEPLNNAIADLLFTRGEGVSDEQFAKGIEHGRLFTLPNEDIVTTLGPLSSSVNLRIRTAACAQLRYYGKPCN
jgi:hypothetical protein